MTRVSSTHEGEAALVESSWLRLARQQGNALVARQLACAPRGFSWPVVPERRSRALGGRWLAWAGALAAVLGLAGGTWALVARTRATPRVASSTGLVLSPTLRRTVPAARRARPAALAPVGATREAAATEERGSAKDPRRRERRRAGRMERAAATSGTGAPAPRAAPEIQEMPDEVIIVVPYRRLGPLFFPEDFVRRPSLRP